MPQLSDSLRVAAARVQADLSGRADTVLDTAFWYSAVFRLVRVAFIVLLAVAVLAAVRQVRRRWVRRVDTLAPLDPRRQRTLTVSGLVGSAARYGVWGVGGIMALNELGFNVGPLLASAGVAGLAIGFGAQTMVKDVISGVFLLFDQTIQVGDTVRIGADEGVVEYIGLRLIKVRKFDGELMMIPAGELRTFGNKSVGYVRVIVDVGLPYEQDVDESLTALNAIAQEWAAQEQARAVMLEERPEVQAVMALGDVAVTARVVVQVRPGEQAAAERTLRRLIKKRFYERGLALLAPRAATALPPAPKPA